LKKVAIYGQSYSISAEKEVKILLEVLHENNIVVFIEKQFYNLLINNNVIHKKYPTFFSFFRLKYIF
jgi:NAD+ kinase